MENKARIVAAVLMGLLMAGAVFFMKRHKANTQEQVREAETGVTTFKEGEFRRDVKQAQEHWQAALKAVSNRDLPAAFKSFQQAKSALSTYVDHYADKTVEPGVTVKTWVQQQEQALRDALLVETPRLFEAVAAGDAASDEVKQLVQNFAYYGLKDLEQRFKEEEPRIIEARAKAAPRWLRVSVSSDQPEYAEIIRRELGRKWNARFGQKLVFGYALNDLERRATWKALDIRIEQENARYAVVGNSQLKWKITPPEVPRSVTFTFKSQGTPEVPTTWEPLQPIRAAVEVPESLWIKMSRYGAVNEANQVKLDKQKELIAAAAKALETLPEFRVFPNVDASSVQLRRGNTLDLEAARALGYLDRSRLVRELPELARDPALSGSVALVVVAHEVTELAPWLAQTLPALPRNTQTPAMKELENKPWFGEYDPLLAVVAKSTREYPQDAAAALRGQLKVPKVREAVLQQIARSPFRDNWLYLFVPEASPDDLRALAPKWICDTNQHFSQSAFLAVGNRDRALATQLALDLFDRVPEPTQVVFFDHFNRSRSQPTPETTQLLRKAATTSRNREVRAAAIRALESRAYEADAWDILQTVLPAETDPRRRTDLEGRLILNALRAHPVTGRQFLMDALSSTNAQSRDLAIGQLLLQDNPTPELFRALAQMISRQSSDRTLLRTVMNNISQHSRLRRGWTFADFQPDLSPLLLAAAGSPDPQVRRQSYEVMGYAIKKGAVKYAELLQAAQPNEADPKLQTEIARQLATKPEPGKPVTVNAREPLK